MVSEKNLEGLVCSVFLHPLKRPCNMTYMNVDGNAEQLNQSIIFRSYTFCMKRFDDDVW